jgi:hypothetical protein
VLSGTGDFVYTSTPKDLKAALSSNGYSGVIENSADVVVEVASSLTRENDQRNWNNPSEETDIDESLAFDLEENSKTCNSMILARRGENRSLLGNLNAIEIQVC